MGISIKNQIQILTKYVFDAFRKVNMFPVNRYAVMFEGQHMSSDYSQMTLNKNKNLRGVLVRLFTVPRHTENANNNIFFFI